MILAEKCLSSLLAINIHKTVTAFYANMKEFSSSSFVWGIRTFYSKSVIIFYNTKRKLFLNKMNECNIEDKQIWFEEKVWFLEGSLGIKTQTYLVRASWQLVKLYFTLGIYIWWHWFLNEWLLKILALFSE